MKRTLKKGLKEFEIVKRESFVSIIAWVRTSVRPKVIQYPH